MYASIEKAARIFGVSKNSVATRCRDGTFVAFRIGTRWVIDIEGTAEKLIKEQQCAKS